MLRLTKERENNLRFFLKMLAATTRVSSFLYDENMNVISAVTNWENQIRNFFLLNCPLDLNELLHSENNQPLLFFDELNLSWIIQPLPGMDSILVLGPAVENDLTYPFLQKQLAFSEMSVSSRNSFMKMIKDIPVISVSSFIRYGNMLHYGIYEETCEFRFPSFGKVPADSQKNTNIITTQHGSRQQELEMLDRVRTGIMPDPVNAVSMNVSEVGILSRDNPLRQARNLIITQVTLVTRAAVDGGMDAESAYSLSDYYIQQLEMLDSAQDIYALSLEMVRTFTQAVQEARMKGYSSIVKYLCTWIDKHADEEISLENLGANIGYDPYYITTLFRKETGQTIKTYILERKIARAQILLQTTNLSIQDISDCLSFRSPSYFAARFRKQTGKSPAEYRKEKKQTL